MESLSLGPEWIVLGLIATFLLGVLTIFVGERLPKRTNWIAAAALIPSVISIVAQWISRGEISFSPEFWQRGWIRPGVHGLDVGILEDPISFSISLLILIIAFTLVSQRKLLENETRLSRALGGTVMAASGAALAWVSLTLWLSFLGIGVAVLGGFLVFGADWESEEEAGLASRFARERAWGLILLLLGAAGLAGLGIDLAWVPGKTEALFTQVSGGVLELGVSLLCAGLLVLFHPAPLLGWLTLPSKPRPSLRIVVGYLFPASAAFSLAWHLLPALITTHAFSVFAWIACGLSVLTAVSGLLQRDLRAAQQTLASAYSALAFAAMLALGPWASLALHIAALVGVSALTLALGNPSAVKSPSPMSARANKWAGAGAVVAALSLAGLPSFISAGATVSWMASFADQPALMAGPAAAFLSCALLAWRVGELIRRASAPASWWNALAPYLLLAFGMAWLWTGALTGGFIPGNPDLLVQSILEKQFNHSQGGLTTDAWAVAMATSGGVLIFAFTLGLWWMRRGGDVAQSAHRRFSKSSAVIEQSYAIDKVFVPLLASIRAAGGAIAQTVDVRVWNTWIPRLGSKSLDFVGRNLARADYSISETIIRSARRSVEAPAKLLQLIQSGNVQWYLLFAVGAGIVLLLHFLRF